MQTVFLRRSFARYRVAVCATGWQSGVACCDASRSCSSGFPLKRAASGVLSNREGASYRGLESRCGGEKRETGKVTVLPNDERLPANPDPVVLFDGTCGLCHRFVRFVIRRDRQVRFRFVALQSEPGRILARHAGLDTQRLDSVVLLDRGAAFTRSGAAIRILTDLGGMWRFASLLGLVPRFLRDYVYELTARNRYRWFASSGSCGLPGDRCGGRFLDELEDGAPSAPTYKLDSKPQERTLAKTQRRKERKDKNNKEIATSVVGAAIFVSRERPQQ